MKIDFDYNKETKEAIGKISLERMTSSMINIGEMIKETAKEVFDRERESIENFLALLLWAFYNRISVYFSGQGRSGHKGAYSFAMRLTHLGMICYLCGDLGITTPWIKDKALLIAISGSGETNSNIEICRHIKAELKKKKNLEVKIVAVTADKDSELASHSDVLIILPEKKEFLRRCNSYLKRQLIEQPIPMGDYFENVVSIFLDVVVAEMMNITGVTEEEMKERHVRNRII